MTTPPPAVLISNDGQTRLSIEVLRWETGLLPCTRYDEWLVVRLALHTADAKQEGEGAFLLRFELEEILQAAQQASENAEARFASDFLEPVLRFTLRKGDEQPAQTDIHLALPESDHKAGVSAIFSSPDEDLSRFATELTAQLAGFPSRL